MVCPLWVIILLSMRSSYLIRTHWGLLLCRGDGSVSLMGELTEGIWPLLPFESPRYLPSTKTHARAPIAAATLSQRGQPAALSLTRPGSGCRGESGVQTNWVWQCGHRIHSAPRSAGTLNDLWHCSHRMTARLFMDYL